MKCDICGDEFVPYNIHLEYDGEEQLVRSLKLGSKSYRLCKHCLLPVLLDEIRYCRIDATNIWVEENIGEG